MRPSRAVTFASPLLLGILLAGPRPAPALEPPSSTAAPGAAAPGAKPAPDMAAMMAAAKRYTAPGENHKVLERFLGKWATEARFFMAGEASPPETGVATVAWLIPGRWLKFEGKGTLMGRPFEFFYIVGYDNFKQSFVTVTVSSMDTALIHLEGDMDPGGKALLSYGTLDEYLTGEHDKMVKSVWRFLSPDKLVLEVHDLPIGENNTKVIEIAYTRQP